MSSKATYLDSSALVKLVLKEHESPWLHQYLRRRRPLVSSALARTEMARALLHLGDQALRQGEEVLARVDLLRVNDRVLEEAGTLQPVELRSLDAIHLATARQLGGDLATLVTFDARMIAAAEALGLKVAHST